MCVGTFSLAIQTNAHRGAIRSFSGGIVSNSKPYLTGSAHLPPGFPLGIEGQRRLVSEVLFPVHPQPPALAGTPGSHPASSARAFSSS